MVRDTSHDMTHREANLTLSMVTHIRSNTFHTRQGQAVPVLIMLPTQLGIEDLACHIPPSFARQPCECHCMTPITTLP